MKKKLGPFGVVVLGICATVFGYLQYNEYNIEQGRKAYHHYGCAQCHEAGAAPDLTKVTNLDKKTMARFIEDPEDIYREKGKRPLNQGYMPMPRLHVSPTEARQLTDFLMSSRQQ